MAVVGKTENSSVTPAEMQQNLEVDEEYNKYTPSADYNSTSNKHIFRNKKFTKKRHESKTRRTDQDASNACCSDEDYPQKTSAKHHPPDVHVPHNIPKMMMSINQTIKQMSLKDTNAFCYAAAVASTSGGATGGGGDSAGPIMTLNNQSNLNQEGVGVGDIGVITKEPVARLELDVQKRESLQCNNSPSCNMQVQAHSQGKRRRHRRKQQYKRMAVDVMNDKKCLQQKVPTSNSSEDSGIGKRKRNINIINEMLDLSSKSTSGGSVSVPVPVSNFDGQSAPQWQLDDTDAVMMDCDDLESSSITKVAANLSGQAVLVTEEESGESDTQNGDIESLSDQNQDADDEESDYYNNDSSTTSLSESSFTILNPSKKFIPVHSREIRSGRRRLKTSTSIENEELTKFLQSSKDTTFKWALSSEKERQDIKNLASMYSLSYEEGCDQEEQRVWIQLTKTSKTTTQRRNDMIKAGDRSTFNTYMEGSSLGPLFDTCVTETGEGGENSDGCIDMADGGGRDNVGKGGLSVNQVVNSKRIKKGC
ncbi:hypothetical protein Ocin01_17698 [Orchesella cincta]|uniref:Uncharacterized protein n=1 Tax=Orchesella cincta TaxID=48709 RepID=A0A1D2M7P2_ORCCI|nr:hypothetical protein Ocin01_17698 [Orchesella cincta]